jgi:hypothetical protein
MDLKVRTASGGDYVRPDNGYYLLRFDGIEDAGEWDNFDKTKKINKMRMVFAAFTQVERTPILMVEGEHAGEQMVIKPLMTASGHIKSTCYAFGSVVLGREPAEDEDLGALLATKVGTFIVGQVGNDQNQKPGKLKVLMPDMVGGDVGAYTAPAAPVGGAPTITPVNGTPAMAPQVGATAATVPSMEFAETQPSAPSQDAAAIPPPPALPGS